MAKTYYDEPRVKEASTSRISSSPSFTAIRETVSKLEKINDKEYSLNIRKYKAEQKEIKAAIKRMEEMNKNKKELDIALLPSDEKRLSADNDKLERRKQWRNALAKDIYLEESTNVMHDMITQTALARRSG